MFDTSILAQNPFEASAGNNSLTPTPTLHSGTLTSEPDPFLTPTPQHQSALHSCCDADLSLNSNLETAAAFGSDASGSAASELFLFASPESVTLNTGSTSQTEAVANELTSQASGDSLTGMNGNAPLVGNSTQSNVTTSLIWRDYTTGTNVVWNMNGTTVSSSATLPSVPINWEIEGTADFNNDGQGDILWRDYSTGSNVIWYMNGASVSSSATLPSAATNWEIEGTADFNSDGKADILWRDYTTGSNAVWYMNGASFSSSATLPSVATNWELEGTGDFNSDGKADILWRDYSTGTNAVWYMDGASFSSSAILPSLATNWELEGTGDFNSDGKTDIFWRDYTTGTNAVWYMNGTSFSSYDYLTSVATNWEMEGVLLSSTTSTTTDWFSQNLSDSGIANLTRSLAADGELSRNDMISIFRDTKDGNVIDAAELTDLRTIVSNSSRFNMQDHVRVLSGKIANDSVANQQYQGATLGNLFAGSTATHMETLIGKWFLGLDRPSTFVPANGDTPAKNITYGLASGSLFGNDGTFSYQDIQQGYLGDCYFLASLGAVALQNPSAIRDMFIDNGDGTYTVRLFGQNNGTVNTAADYVTVDSYLPVNVSDGFYSEPLFANYDNANVGLWVALAEKAYAQFAESGLAQRNIATNNYGSIEGGYGYRAMPSILGSNADFYSDINDPNRQDNFLSLSSIASMLASGSAMAAGTISNPGLGIVGLHEYIIVGTNTANGTLTLYNPHGVTRTGETNGIRVISYNDFRANFFIIDVA